MHPFSHNLKLTTILAGLLIMPLAAMAAVTYSEPMPSLQATGEKLMHYRPSPNDNRPSYSNAVTLKPAPLHVQLGTEKRFYYANEKIQFNVRGNRDFYLYLFNRDPKTGHWLTILPNRLQTADRIKYPGDNKPRLVPNPQVEFFSNQPGTEEIVMVASERYLSVDKMNALSQAKALGDYYQWQNPLESLKAAINDSYADQLTEKTLQIRPSNSHYASGLYSDSPAIDGLATQEFNLTIY